MLRADDLGPLRDFYEGRLGLPTVASADDEVCFQAGQSELCFRRHPEPALYHFAFNIAPAKIESAFAWLQGRAPLRMPDVVDFPNWNAHAVYFVDPLGNILEFIARHDMPSADTSDFGTADIWGVSEIGVVVDDVAEAVRDFQQRLSLPVYKGSVSNEFAALGDDEGLLIVVRTGRPWFSSPSLLAKAYPTDIEFAGGATLQI